LKLLLTLFLGLPLSFGLINVNQWIQLETYDETPSIRPFDSSCHWENYPMLTWIESLSLEEQSQVLMKLDEILVAYEVTSETFLENPHDYPTIMHEFMTYLLSGTDVQYTYNDTRHRHHKYN
jgi:hypothetical protein